MSLPGANTTLKRLKNRYRIVLINEDSLEEVVNVKLNRVSVYVLFSSMFVLLVGLTVALIAFTPLKLYIPGYGDARQAREYRQLKLKTDSIENALVLKQQYMDNIEQILKGPSAKRDTNLLKVKNPGKSTY
jgi:hypothetical protein